jgi:hypothetical protein
MPDIDRENLDRSRAIVSLFGLSVAEVARAGGVSRPYVSRMLGGSLTPSTAFWRTLEANLGRLVEIRTGQVFLVEPSRVDNAVSHSLQAVRPGLRAGSDPAWRGRLAENAVGAHLLNALHPPGWSIHYWRKGDFEVDYVVARGDRAWALEVKSGRGGRLSGLWRNCRAQKLTVESAPRRM